MLKAAHEAVAGPEGQRVADQRPQNGNEPHHGEALHHGSQDVLAADQAAIKKSQTGRGHQQNQRGGDQHPGIVA